MKLILRVINLKCIYVGDIFLILPGNYLFFVLVARLALVYVVLAYLSNVLWCYHVETFPTIRTVAHFTVLETISSDEIWQIQQPYNLRCGLLQVWRP